MTFKPEQIELLSKKLDNANVRPPEPSKGIYGSYIEGWKAIDEANRIFGFDGWSYRIVALTQTNKNESGGTHHIGFMCHVAVEAGGVTREDVGHGQGHAKQEGGAYDSAIKEAVTDGLKRALKSFGNPFGLALYDKSGENVERSNGSTRPPPKQQEPAVSADDLIERVAMAQTFQALKATKGHEGFRHDYLALDKAGRSRVEAAIAEKEAMFGMGAG